MGIIDKAIYTLTCPKCGMNEKASVCDKGSMYSGSNWNSKANFLKFETEWEGGGNEEPTLNLALCMKCKVDAIVESHYGL